MRNILANSKEEGAVISDKLVKRRNINHPNLIKVLGIQSEYKEELCSSFN